MKKLALAVATLVSMAIIGCSEQPNPVEQSGAALTGPAQVLVAGNTGGTTFDNPDGPIFITIPEYDTVVGATEITKTINHLESGSIMAKVMYFRNGVKVFSVSAQIKFPVGSLDATRAITIRMDPSTLGFEFLPHGITFGKPALLTIDTYGLDLTGFTTNNTDLWYHEAGQWLESYQGRLIKMFPQNGKLMVSEIKLRHFSQYAFGRRR